MRTFRIFKNASYFRILITFVILEVAAINIIYIVNYFNTSYSKLKLGF